MAVNAPQATERIADPSMISLLISFVLCARNKLAALVQGVPKDPFLHPHEFLAVLSSYAHFQINGGHAAATHLTGAGSTSPVSPVPFNFNLSASTSSPTHSAISPTTVGVPLVYLTLSMYNTLQSTYERLRHTDSRRVHRVLLSRLEVSPTSEEDTDEERRGLGERVMGLVGRTNVGAECVVSPTADMGGLMKAVLIGRDREKVRERGREGDRDRGSKDGDSWKERVDGVDEKERVAGSLRMLWGGKVDILVRMRERAEGRWVCPAWRNELERERGGNTMRSDVDDPVMKGNVEDDLIFGGAWSGKVQKKLEMWTRWAILELFQEY